MRNLKRLSIFILIALLFCGLSTAWAENVASEPVEAEVPEESCDLGDGIPEADFASNDVSNDEGKPFVIENGVLKQFNGSLYHSTDVIIPSGVREIRCSFCGANVTSVTIPNGVTTIGGNTFDGCSNLTRVTIPGTVTSIGPWTFRWCTSLSSIEIPRGVKSIEQGTFNYCTSLTEITIPDSVTSIGDDAFWKCESLVNVTIPDGVTHIGTDAFAHCISLPSIKIPGSVKSVGRSAFSECSSLTSAVFCGGATEIGEKMFERCYKLAEVTLPYSLISIGDNAFWHCESLTNVTIPEHVTSIGTDAFNWCGLTEVTIPGSVASISEGAFGGCLDLARVTIRDGVKQIENRAFENCHSLVEIIIEGKDTAILNPDGDWGPFKGCWNTSMTFYVPCQSLAGDWAEAHGFKVVKNHVPVKDPGVPATESQTGLTEGSHCNICGVVLQAQRVIPMLDPTPPSDGVYITPMRVNPIGLKESVQLSLATANPDIKPGKLTWKSSDKKVATVTAKGKVTGKGDGTATITVTAANGFTASIEITVRDVNSPTAVAIEPAKPPVIGLKEKLSLTAVLTAEGTPKTKLKWASSDKKVATVSAKGLVTGKAAGTTIITVTTSNKKSASVEVTVKDINSPLSVAIEPASVEPIAVKGTVQLTAVLTAEGEPKTKLKWTSDNKKVATVSGKGLVTGKSAGTAKITVTTSNKKSATVEITVTG